MFKTIYLLRYMREKFISSIYLYLIFKIYFGSTWFKFFLLSFITIFRQRMNESNKSILFSILIEKEKTTSETIHLLLSESHNSGISTSRIKFEAWQSRNDYYITASMDTLSFSLLIPVITAISNNIYSFKLYKLCYICHSRQIQATPAGK